MSQNWLIKLNRNEKTRTETTLTRADNNLDTKRDYTKILVHKASVENPTENYSLFKL
jgi:hypothetical protein